MRVKFKRQFFGPDGFRYRAGAWHDVPDGWGAPAPKLKETEILDRKNRKVKVHQPKYRVLPDDVEVDEKVGGLELA